MITLLLVDDHAMLLEGLARQFNDRKGFKVVGRATSGQDVMEVLVRLQPDVITLDVSLPDVSGLTLIPRIKEKYPDIRILVLTMYDHERYASSALQAGAHGFLPKGAPFEELERAVKEVVAGRIYLPAGLSDRLKKDVVNKAESPLKTLSKREFAVLLALSRGLPLKQVAGELGISDKTVSTYRTRLMEKLGLDSSSELVRFAIENGLLK
jgi:DNA-binding NarL/FixJ family response regulator